MRFNSILLSTFAASAIATDHIVTVGGDNQDIYSVPELKAEKGDTVTFQFLAGTHDVIQGSFNKPCEPISGGFASHIITVNHTAKAVNFAISPTSQLTYVVTITDPEPKWFYCSRGKHCQSGMVGVINPSAAKDQTLDMYRKAAKKVVKAVRPDGSASGTAPSSTSTSSLTSKPSTSISATTASTATSASSSSFSNSTMSATTTSSTTTISSSASTSTTSQQGTKSTSSTTPKTTTGAAASNMGGSAVGLIVLVAGAIVFG